MERTGRDWHGAERLGLDRNGRNGERTGQDATSAKDCQQF